jgi:hypothetical protein
MSMNEENFDSLRRLLALKRHEQPPPGYFNELARKISARLTAEPAPRFSFWERFLPTPVWKTAMAGGFSLAATCALFFAIHTSLTTDNQATAVPNISHGNANPAATLPANLEVNLVSAGPTNSGSTNPVMELPSFLNGSGLQIERVNSPQRNGR